MPIEEKTPTQEETIEQENHVEQTRSKLDEMIKSGDVFNSLDLPGAEEPPKSADDKVKDVVKDVIGEEETEENQSDEESEDEEVTQEESTEQETEEDEELIPKSKVQKRIDALTARIKQLESETAKQPETSAKDDVTKKLEGMSEAELKQAKREARLAQIKYAADEEKLNHLLELEEKIDATIQSAPQRFSSLQVQSFNEAAKRLEVKSAADGIDLSKAAETIKQFAIDIYRETPEFQKSIHGQARALEMAYRNYVEISKVGTTKQGKSEELNRLKSQVNSLKKKTSLDTKTVKGNMDKTRSVDLRRKAVNGTMNDKLAFVQNDPAFRVDDMIPPEYKE